MYCCTIVWQKEKPMSLASLDHFTSHAITYLILISFFRSLISFSIFLMVEWSFWFSVVIFAILVLYSSVSFITLCSFFLTIPPSPRNRTFASLQSDPKLRILLANLGKARWSTCVLVCFSWHLDPEIYFKLRREWLLYKVEKIHKITTFFNQNDNFVHPRQLWVSFCEFD